MFVQEKFFHNGLDLQVNETRHFLGEKTSKRRAVIVRCSMEELRPQVKVDLRNLRIEIRPESTSGVAICAAMTSRILSPRPEAISPARSRLRNSSSRCFTSFFANARVEYTDPIFMRSGKSGRRTRFPDPFIPP